MYKSCHSILLPITASVTSPAYVVSSEMHCYFYLLAFEDGLLVGSDNCVM